MVRALFSTLLRGSAFNSRLCTTPRSLFTRARLGSSFLHVTKRNDTPVPPVGRPYSTTPSSMEVEKMIIGFTCKVCNHRTHRTMSKLAYTRGVVLIECPGCRNRHLIADHLGWFDRTREEGRTIEEILSKRGEQVHRSWNTDSEGVSLLEVLENEGVRQDG